MDDKENLNNNNLENQSNPNLGNVNTDANSNFNPYNMSQEFSNGQTQNSNDNEQYINPYVQSGEENPYYNPYFQNTDIGSSPYIDNNDNAVNLFGMGDDNSNNTFGANESSPEAEPVNNSESSTDVELVNNSQSSLDAEPINNIQNSTDAEPVNNSQNSTAAEPISNSVNNFETEPSSQMHINPILSQSINQNSTEPTLNTDNSQFNAPTQDVNNSQYGSMPQDVNGIQSENNMQNQVSSQNTQNTYGSSNDQEFKNTWMGKLYDKANHRKFSFPAFFFGGLYYLYRKLYLIGFIFLIISCIIPIVGSTLIASSAETGNATIPFILTFALPIIINLVYGFAFYPLYNSFVNKKLQKLKDVVQSPNQLIDEARKNGGKSIGFLLLGIVLNVVIYAIALSTIFMTVMSNFISMFGGLVPQDNKNGNNNTLANNMENFETIYETYNFYNDYYFDYDASAWTLDTDNRLVSDNYTLSYIQSIENLVDVGFDINQAQGRSSFFTYLYNLFSSQIDATTTTLELGSSSFVYNNGIYYSYFDLVYSASIERCYFVLIPENDIFIEFILSNTDTVIPDDIHNEVVSYICSITNAPQEQASDEINGNSINENTILNGNSVDVDDGIATSGSIDAGSLNEYATPASGSNSSNTTPSSNGGLTVTSPSGIPGISTAYNVVTQ